MNNKNSISEKEVNERIEKVNGAMAQEGMPLFLLFISITLTDEEKEVLRNCIIGKTTHAIERDKILTQCRSLYGR